MLTRLCVKGFKNLLDVDVRFGPFTCIVGPNGVGKSNLFDAIRLLGLLANHPLAEAARLLRTSKGRALPPRTLFSSFGHYRAETIDLTAEMIVPAEVEDDYGVRARAATTALEYRLVLRLDAADEAERLQIVHEALLPRPRARVVAGLDYAARRFVESCLPRGSHKAPFISTDGRDLLLHPEGHEGRTRRTPAERASLTVLGGARSSEFPTVLAARREMESWRLLSLEPSAMRAPSEYADPRAVDALGGNVPATLSRLMRVRGDSVRAAIANRLAELVEDIRDVGLLDDPRSETLTLQITAADGVAHPARAVSDGTLRFVVLATLAADPQATGVICIEEPENGIHPERVPALVRLLRQVAVDAEQPVGPDNPLRQVIVNTHSPLVVREVRPDELVDMEFARVTRGGQHGNMARALVPRRTWRAELAPTAVAAPGALRRTYVDPPRPTNSWESGG